MLDEKHQQAVKEIVYKNRKKKSCNKCYDRGYIGFTLDKNIIPCEKCVDIDAAMEEWKKYVSNDSELKEQYNDLFEEEVEENDSDSKEELATETVEKTDVNVEPELPTENEQKVEAGTPTKKVKADPSKNTQTTRKPAVETKAKTTVSKKPVQSTKTSTVRKTTARGK